MVFRKIAVLRDKGSTPRRFAAKIQAVINAFPSAIILWPAIAAFALTGPFGTYESLSFSELFVYWSVAIVGNGLFFNAFVLMTLTHPALSGIRRPIRLTMGALAASPFGAVMLYLLDNYFRGSSSGPLFFLWLCACVFLVGLAITLIQYRKQTASEIEFEKAGKEPSFLDRLPTELGQDVQSMSMNDHYVQVFTNKGNALVHAKFADAVAGTGELLGVQCHRSHWVAIRAIKDAKLSGRNKHVVLVDDRQIPVSDAHAGHLRDLLDNVS